ncbi:activating signal cointegrator 1 complex subunit 2 [Tribolium madens]|uniref:activating signal cointegrator 1 complex subunit 2 n=1 Tax=Tribolium madens TaxID=41895 RepID=UPI001CF73673|nr:activating signal cointegrator 1 complex subunit 2 [Tribolium madens]
MEELSEIIKNLDLEDVVNENVGYEYINVFKNPNKLPINHIHLEKVVVELRKEAPLESIKPNDDIEKQCFERKTQVIPALSKCWLPESQQYYKYQPYNFTLSKKENSSYLISNRLFLQTLHYLLSCNYHQFWCLVLYEPKVAVCLHSFLLNPILPHQIKNLDDETCTVYLAVFSQFRRVYQRLTTFQETESEYMPDGVGLQFLLENKLLNLPIVITLFLFYHETNQDFVNDLVSLYFNGTSVFRDKEIEEMLDQVILTLEMIGGHVCGFEPDAVIIPIAVEEKPPVFNLAWVFSVVDYLLNTISSLRMLLKFYKPAINVALSKGIPYRLSYTYEKVFYQLYDFLDGRKELEQNRQLSGIIFEEIALGRSEFIDVYYAFTTYCLDKTLEFSGDPVHQEEYVEIYLKLLTTALEDEYFICDYHERYDVGIQNEMFSSCTEIDQTRTDYILNCITCLRRHNRLWKTLRCEVKTLQKAIQKYASNRKVKSEIVQENGLGTQPGPSNHVEETFVPPSEEEIENCIRMVIDMFPHLGDGFILQCLEAYNYNTSDLIGAILEQNLPPHLVDIPFDQIRIPPEPKPEEPILAYKGRKPDYDDALKLLNDKRDIKEIKTFILDGIQYTNEFDVYDDEYDDRADEATVPVPDHGSEDILKFNPNYEDVVSDTSYSEDEYDDEGKPVGASDRPHNKANFCEDPAVIRARREARYRSQGKGQTSRPKAKTDVVGKQKGQGQEKNVLQNRHKKSVNKSSRANHNRKSGAQWKRNKGMVPS